MLIKILLVISIIVQTLATAYALRLVRATKYNSVWILFIVGFSLLSVERFVQLLMAGTTCRAGGSAIWGSWSRYVCRSASCTPTSCSNTSTA